MHELGSEVLVIDDDESVRFALGKLLRSAGYDVRCFGSARAFLAARRPEAPACLVLDVRLPDINGLDLQRELEANEPRLPIVFMTGYGDIPMAVRAMKRGAIEFLSKPVGDYELLDAVAHGLVLSTAAWQEHGQLSALRARFEALTPRERDVLELVVSGLLNKQIAAELGIREATVKIHRGEVMYKTGAKSVAQLVRMVGQIGELSSYAEREESAVFATGTGGLRARSRR